ncbi:MAG: glycosyltransferase, partial [Oscillospiraceae bacterium]
MKKTINMLSHADSAQGQGVLSAYLEQTKLIKENLNDKYILTYNKIKPGRINHYHTINPGFLFFMHFLPKTTIKVGYVHFLPETVKTSLKLNKLSMAVFNKYMLYFYKSMDYIVVVNPYFIDRLAYYGVNKEAVTYIPNFVDEEKFYVINDKINLRKKYGLLTDKFTVFCAGQLQTRKGFFDFIECAKKLPNMQFVWAGGFSFGA